MFDLGDAGGVLADRYWDDAPSDSRVDHSVKLGMLNPGQQFVYVFDLGDNWAHLCTVSAERIDPLDTIGLTPQRPTPYWGRGTLPEQYGRAWDGDDGETPAPPDPALTDLPPLQPGWGRTRFVSAAAAASNRPTDALRLSCRATNRLISSTSIAAGL